MSQEDLIAAFVADLADAIGENAENQLDHFHSQPDGTWAIYGPLVDMRAAVQSAMSKSVRLQAVLTTAPDRT